MRQLSIALITFNWAWLTWPRLASTPSGTVVAEDIRDLQSGTAHDCARGYCRRLSVLGVERRQPIERAQRRRADTLVATCV